MTITDISPENVARMLDGVTPLPWKCCETTIHGLKYGGCWVEGPDVDDGDGMPRGLLIPISGGGGAMSYTTRLVDIQGHDHNDANARFIAWAREAVPALATRLAEVDAEAGKMLAEADQDYARKTNALILRHTGQLEQAKRRAEAAEAKVARLTEALRAIAANKPTEAPTGATDVKGHCAWRSYNIARAALEETKE